MKTYSFTTYWTFQAPLPVVWDIIRQSARWPEWWKALKKVEIEKKGDGTGLGEVSHSYWRTALPYSFNFRFTVTAIEKYRFIDGRAEGDLTGSGKWSFSEKDGITTVRYDWSVATSKPWMNALAPLLKPFFVWNHDTVMRWGEEGLARRLEREPVA